MQTVRQPSARDGVDYALRSYLALIAGGAPSAHFLEIRFRVREQLLVSEFHPAHDRDTLVEAIRSRGSRTDVYLGCAPRSRRAGTKDAVSQVWTLWAECDGEEAAHRLRRFRPQPALVVASGSGSNCHAYWPLVAPLSPRRAEAANLRLVHAMGADPNCFDASRILRPPGTWNHKHHPPHPVGVLRLHAELRFTSEEVVAHLPTIDDEILQRRWDAETRGLRNDPLLSVPPRVYVGDLLGRRPGRDGKVQCPFHTDEHASLHAYPTGTRGWFCFSCRRGGTIYDLAAAVWGLQTRGRDFVEIQRRLLDRYRRELSVGRTLSGMGR
ncbi:CHC2 zinc finger domain-containing protein [Candidatus Solirubrobacter pratensis]|uniref:CHC2 zinc finger domain-containing protein n=1 Tax=Candidatus Solirubrobacter pratensis TaxID=1298857 RepID=UPI0009DC1A4F|nr:DNA-primase RepB domain-containing protein [Candidatus Solirubrobacter pratensis]